MKRIFLSIYMIVMMSILAACGSSDKEIDTQEEDSVQESENQEEESEEDGISPGENAADSSDKREYQVGDMIEYTSGLKVTIVDSGIYSKEIV